MASVKKLKRKYNHKDRYVNQEIDAIYSLISGFHDEVMDPVSGALTVDETGDLTVNGNLIVTGTTNLQGAADLDTSLNVDGTGTLDGLVVDGASDLNGVADISDTLTLSKVSDTALQINSTDTIDAINLAVGGILSALGTFQSTAGTVKAANVEGASVKATTRVITNKIKEEIAGFNVTIETDSDLIVQDTLQVSNITADAGGTLVTIDDDLDVTGDLDVGGDLTVTGLVPAGTLNENIRVLIAEDIAGGADQYLEIDGLADYFNDGWQVEVEFEVQTPATSSDDLRIQLGKLGSPSVVDTSTTAYSWRTARRNGTSWTDDNGSDGDGVYLGEDENAGWVVGTIKIATTSSFTQDVALYGQTAFIRSPTSKSAGTFVNGTWDGDSDGVPDIIRLLYLNSSTFSAGSRLKVYGWKDL